MPLLAGRRRFINRVAAPILDAERHGDVAKRKVAAIVATRCPRESAAHRVGIGGRVIGGVAVGNSRRCYGWPYSTTGGGRRRDADGGGHRAWVITLPAGISTAVSAIVPVPVVENFESRRRFAWRYNFAPTGNVSAIEAPMTSARSGVGDDDRVGDRLTGVCRAGGTSDAGPTQVVGVGDPSDRLVE